MAKANIFSNKVYLSNILRNMLASAAGFLTVWICFIIFETHRTEEDVFIAGIMIFFFSAVLFFLTSILENFLFLLLKKKRLFPFLITQFSLFAILLFAIVYLEKEFSTEAAVFLFTFILLQIVGFLYQMRKGNLNA